LTHKRVRDNGHARAFFPPRRRWTPHKHTPEPQPAATTAKDPKGCKYRQKNRPEIKMGLRFWSGTPG
jgi:hypothetical protein